MMLQPLGLFLFLYVVSLQCKLILSTNASKLVQNEGSYAEIVNSSLQRFDNFTLCARYGIAPYQNPEEIITKLRSQIPHLQFLRVL